MAINSLAGLLGASLRFDWWRGFDDMWRWGVRAREIWAYDAADAATRASIRSRRIASMLEHARTRSPFYRTHYRHVPPGCGDLAAHSPVNRRQLMAAFDDWAVDREIRLADALEFVADPERVAEPYLGKYAVWTSSGTTGIPGVYLQDADALSLYSALMSVRFPFGEAADARRMIGGGSRMAFVAALGGHFAGVVSWERQRRLHPALAATSRAFSILQPLPELVAQLNDWQPAFVASYPTMLGLLAREQSKGRLRLEPRGLWCGGEGLSTADRAVIEGIFGCRIVEDYGASECMNMAFSCTHGRLHLNDDWVVLEPVDEQGRAVPPGQPSVTVLVTNLANRVQPLIRYDLSDSVAIDDTPCACGNTRPSVRVEGRRDDVMVLPGTGGSTVRILPLAIETVLEEEAGVYRFQLTQTAHDAMSIRLSAADDRERQAAWRKCKTVIAQFLTRHGCEPVGLSFDPNAPEMDPVSGKLRQVRVLPEARVND